MVDYIKTGLYSLVALSILMLGSVSLYYKHKYNELSDSVDLLKDKLENSEKNNHSLEASIVTQNQQIEALSADYNNSIKTYTVWKKSPPEVRYETIYKEVEVKSNECNDTKNRISFVRNIDFNKL